MAVYDPALPLIAIHIPKAAGSSVQTIYRRWFGAGFLDHYFHGGPPPPRRRLEAPPATDRPVVLYGHFNRLRGMGIEDRYPEVTQFVTILRDPFERAVSRHFYLRRRDGRTADLRTDLLHQKPEWSMLCHFPRGVTMDNYRQVLDTFFIEIGIVEQLEESLRRIAGKLGKDYEPRSVPLHNASPRDEPVPYELAEEFAERHPLEYAVYRHVAGRFG